MKMKIFLCVLACMMANQVANASVATHKKIHECVATIAGKTYVCSLGRSGTAIDKKEGDGATPVGTYPLRKIFYRPDVINVHEIKSSLPLQALQTDDGWCDDVKSKDYNTYIKLPFPFSHENLWRDDHVYDLIVVVGYNDNPPVKGKGSAIFLHIARPDYSATAGCIAFAKQDLLAILAKLTPQSKVTITKDNKVSFE